MRPEEGVRKGPCNPVCPVGPSEGAGAGEPEAGKMEGALDPSPGESGRLVLR